VAAIVSYYERLLRDFLASDTDAVVGELATAASSVDGAQLSAWRGQIEFLKEALASLDERPVQIYFEFFIPRMGRRADVILLLETLVVVIEFKVNAKAFDASARNQVHDYALDLKNFHEGSHHVRLLPIVVSTAADYQGLQTACFAADGVAEPLRAASAQDLVDILSNEQNVPTAEASERPLAESSATWAHSGYKPTPTIVEAAQALYQQHSVEEITRSDSGARNLSETTKTIDAIIDRAKAGKFKAICFVTGVPGAGKTLAGLNIATQRADTHADEHATFLSGNGPLVDVLREALARDKAGREGVPIGGARRAVEQFIQNIHHFRNTEMGRTQAPAEKVVIFDEAQRAWDVAQATKFMRKRGFADFNISEPEFLISVMDRHDDWAVIVCLIGGGQEINTGEAGLSEWLRALSDRFQDWRIFGSNRLDDPDYAWDDEAKSVLSNAHLIQDETLHLRVSVRSFRAEALSTFIGHIVENRPADARDTFKDIRENYPIALTRSLSTAREWLRSHARGNERFGLVASSGAYRLRPDGLNVKAKVDAPLWFLNDQFDVRSSFYLEEVATEFDVQGLELDWIGVCWDADFRYSKNQFENFKFSGTRWQSVRQEKAKLYLKNAYRVLMTRARQGLIVYISPGDQQDPTRLPAFYDETVEYLTRCGIPIIG
jgi:DUF2075 family protein